MKVSFFKAIVCAGILAPASLWAAYPSSVSQCGSLALRAAKSEVKKEFPRVADETRYDNNVMLLGGSEDGSEGPEAAVTAFNNEISQMPEDDEGALTKGRFIVNVPMKITFDDQGHATHCEVDGTPTIDTGD